MPRTTNTNTIANRTHMPLSKCMLQSAWSFSLNCHVNNYIISAHGEWGTWKAWSGCPSVCIDEMVERNRSCDNPTPDNGGNNCTGNTSELRDCNAHGCPGIDNQSDVPTYYYIGGGVAACFLLTAIVLAAIYKAKQLSHCKYILKYWIAFWRQLNC